MRLPGLVLFVVAATVTAAAPQTAAAQTPEDAEAVYKTRCATCHEAGVQRAPNRDGLRRLPPEAIVTALTTGSMRVQGQELTLAQIQMLSRGLGNAPAAATRRPTRARRTSRPPSAIRLTSRIGTAGARTSHSIASSPPRWHSCRPAMSHA